MPRTSTKGRTKQTPTPFIDLCLEDRIARAHPIARRMLIDGGVNTNDLADIVQLGEVTLDTITSDTYVEACKLMDAAFALGIAIGQLVPQLGANSGAR